MNDNDRIFNNNNGREPTSPTQPSVPARQRQNISKRSKIVDFYNTTRSSYIPTIASSITHLVGSAEESHLPPDSKLFIYDTYTICDNNEYKVNIRGYLYCAGAMTRKNRLMLTLARQLVKSSSNQVADKFQGELGDKLNTPDQYNGEDDESVYSTDSSASSTVSNNTDSILKERLAGFMTRSLPQNRLRIVVGSETKLPIERLSQAEVLSDLNGQFETVIKTDYKPSVIQVSSIENDEVVDFKVVNIIENKPGVSFISDIDDTVKLTGVVSDKRVMFRNVFTRNFNELEIPGFVNWFTAVSSKGCKIHYVSNSPWQLLGSIEKFFGTIGLPYDSIHLKQYSGNVISALMEPSSERKKPTLIKILSDFPQRKFVLIGDTGERDLEAYLALAKLYPQQILKIYMRVVPSSLSDINDKYVYESIMKLVKLREGSKNKGDLIELDSHPSESTILKKIKPKLSPIIPKKPSSLKGQSVSRSAPASPEATTLQNNDEVDDDFTPPKLPKRRVATSVSTSEIEDVPRLPSRAATMNSNDVNSLSATSSSDAADSAHLSKNSVFNMSNVMASIDLDDKRGNLWKERMIRVLNELPDEVGITFFKNVDEVVEESLSIVNKYHK